MTTIGLLICKSGTTGVTTPLYNAYPIDWYSTLGFATATASSIRFTIASGATEAISFVSATTVPGVLNWSAGNYIWETTIVTGNTRVLLHEVVLRRLSANLATVNTYFTSGSLTAKTLITGTFVTGTLAPNYATLNPTGCLDTDRLQLLFVCRNSTTSARTIMPNLNVVNSEFYTNIQLPLSDTITMKSGTLAYINDLITFKNNAVINIVKGFRLIYSIRSKISKLFGSIYNYIAKSWFVRSVTTDIPTVIRTGSNNIELRCDFTDNADLDDSYYKVEFYTKDKQGTPNIYGPFEGIIVKDSSTLYHATYTLDPEDTWYLNPYDIKVAVSKRREA